MRYSFYFIPFALLFSCNAEPLEREVSDKTNELEETVDETGSDYSAKVIENSPDNWGYQILDGENLFINQPHIPAVQGNKGFTSAEKAEKTAQYIIYKLEAGLVPPTVTIEELDSLEVLN